MLIMTILIKKREIIKTVMNEMGTHGRRAEQHTIWNQFIKSKDRRASFVAKSEQILPIGILFKKFKSTAWWFYPGQLLLRVLQSSLMILVPRQSAQVMIPPAAPQQNKASPPPIHLHNSPSLCSGWTVGNSQLHGPYWCDDARVLHAIPAGV